MLSGEATDTNFVVLDFTLSGLIQQSTAIETSTLTITPPMWFSTETCERINSLE
jgi:hypothetical protein